MAEQISVTDGRIRIRPPQMDDADLLLGEAGDANFGFGVVSLAGESDESGAPLGWVACDQQHDWLRPDEVLLRYSLDAAARRSEYSTRAIQLLMHHLATDAGCRTAALRIDPDDNRAAAIAIAAGFTRRSRIDGDLIFARPVPPLSYTDGVVTIRRQRTDDLDRHLEGIDDEQIDWLWEPGQRQPWEALTPDEQRARTLTHLRASQDAFGSGPKWAFSADRSDATYVAYVDCDLANGHTPPGEANISYAGHPAHRGQGNVSRAVLLVTRFLRDHTGARSAHLIVDSENVASLRVARAVGAAQAEHWRDSRGRTQVRHVLAVR